MERKNEAYLAWVRTLPCYTCEAPPPSDPHHIKGVGKFSGTGLKAPDVLTIPLCRRCHEHIHSFPKLWGEQWKMVIDTLLLAFDEGVLEVKNAEKR